MKEDYPRLAAILAYIPIIGWLFAYTVGRNNKLAMFHLRQSIGLVLFLIGVFVLWAMVAWVIAWIPYMAAISAALFALVMAAYLFGLIVWAIGILNASTGKFAGLPLIGVRASRLPIR